MVRFEKALGAVKVIKDQIQYRSQSLFNLARGYFSFVDKMCDHKNDNSKLVKTGVTDPQSVKFYGTVLVYQGCW